MSILQWQAYEMLKQKFGQKEADLFIEYVDNINEKQVVHEVKSLATSKDLMTTREELIKEIYSVKADLNKTIYLVGLIQFLAIVGSVIGIVSLMIK